MITITVRISWISTDQEATSMYSMVFQFPVVSFCNFGHLGLQSFDLDSGLCPNVAKPTTRTCRSSISDPKLILAFIVQTEKRFKKTPISTVGRAAPMAWHRKRTPSQHRCLPSWLPVLPRTRIATCWYGNTRNEPDSQGHQGHQSTERDKLKSERLK